MTTIVATRKQINDAIYRWDAVPCIARLQDRIPDAEITGAIVDAYNHSVKIAIADLPPITADDVSLTAAKDWAASGRSMGVHYDSIQSALHWLDRWLDDSRKR